ncbi:MAG: metallophosphoesterase family protein [Firmicutes bacterium]|nr:metallophosphoesterase family protein [Bacillota bacterium]
MPGKLLKGERKKPFLLRKIRLLTLTLVMAFGMLTLLGLASCAAKPVSAPSAMPADLVVNVGANTAQMNFNWYSDAADTANGAPAVTVKGLGTFKGARGAAAGGKNWNKVTVTDLAPGATYNFQVSGNGTNYSQTERFTATGGGDFTFAAVGDPQLGASGSLDNDIAGWTATVKEIMDQGASFIAGTGDQINDSSQGANSVTRKENQYAGLFAGLNRSGKHMAFAPAMGNHEGGGSGPAGPGRELYGWHYNVPNDAGQPVNGFQLNDYYYRQNNVLFVVLDTAPNLADAAGAKPYIAAFDRELAAAAKDCAGQFNWLVVQTHKSRMSNANHWNAKDINAYSLGGFEDLMTKYQVDLVLTGHDHSYVRTYPLKSSGGPLVNNGVTIDWQNKGDELVNPNGTVYMVLDSASGSKFYAPRHTPKFTSKVEYQSNIPEYTIIKVTAAKLSITTYETGSGKTVDHFSIAKGL